MELDAYSYLSMLFPSSQAALTLGSPASHREVSLSACRIDRRFSRGRVAIVTVVHGETDLIIIEVMGFQNLGQTLRRCLHHRRQRTGRERQYPLQAVSYRTYRDDLERGACADSS